MEGNGHYLTSEASSLSKYPALEMYPTLGPASLHYLTLQLLSKEWSLLVVLGIDPLDVQG